jgi:hypothetical protein
MRGLQIRRARVRMGRLRGGRWATKGGDLFGERPSLEAEPQQWRRVNPIQLSESPRAHAFPRQDLPELCQATPSKTRGRRECRVLCCTRSLVCIGRAHTSRHHRSAATNDIPCAMVLTLIDALSPVSMTLLVTVACKSSFADLAPAQGCQDHTPSPSAIHVARLTT